MSQEIVIEADGAEHTFRGADAGARAQAFVDAWHIEKRTMIECCGSSGRYKIVGPPMVPHSNADRVRFSLSVTFK